MALGNSAAHHLMHCPHTAPSLVPFGRAGGGFLCLNKNVLQTSGSSSCYSNNKKQFKSPFLVYTKVIPCCSLALVQEGKKPSMKECSSQDKGQLRDSF